MMTEYLTRRKSIRLQGYDYSSAGGYFITICAQSRRCIFGEIIEGQVRLNEAGKIVGAWWLKLRERFPTIILDCFVIMPNHSHGIILIEDDVGAIHELPLPRLAERRKMLIPKIVGYFKMNSAKHVNQVQQAPGLSLWQRNYYEHVIRNDIELLRIREYIHNNPLKWDLDRENPASKNFNLKDKLYWKEVFECRGDS
jgi:putative transposase